MVTPAFTKSVMAAPFLLITIFTPPEVFLGFRVAAAGFILIVSCVVFMVQSREVAQGPPPRPDLPVRQSRPVPEWEGGGKFDLEGKVPLGSEPKPAGEKAAPKREQQAQPPQVEGPSGKFRLVRRHFPLEMGRSFEGA